MSARDRDSRARLERDLSRVVHELAPTPEPDLLERAMRAVESTPQRRGRLRLGVRSGRWGWSTVAAVAAGVLAGVAVGLSAASLVGNEPSPSQAAERDAPMASSDVGPSSSPIPSGSPPSPSDDAEPETAIESDAEWEAIDLPDPAPGVDGGAMPSDLVGFDGGYVIVGSVLGFCGSDVLVPEPRCDDRLAELTGEPQLHAAAVWTSDDARSWELVESPTFERGMMIDVATDGERLVASGRVLDSPIVLGSGEGDATIWTSTDGSHWEIVAAGGPLPELVEWTLNGWVGVRNTQTQGPGFLIADGGPQFFSSEDGEVWEPVTEPGELGAGRVEDVAVDGTGMVIAVGYHEVVTAEGMLDTSTPMSWRTTDGRTWEVAADQDAFVIEQPAGGLYMQTVAATSDGWMALGRADDTEGGTGAWTSRDGLTWTRQPNAPQGERPEPEYMSVELLLHTDPGFVATGSIAGDSGSETAIWVSADGATWELIRGHALANWGISALMADGDFVLAAAARSPSTDNYLPIVLLTTR